MMMLETLPLLIGGLALFLYSIFRLSDLLTGIFNEQARSIIEKGTKKLFSAILIGTTLTILMGSSSAVIILTIIFVNSKALNFKQSMGIIMGANIGTTFSSQLMAMDLGKIAGWIMAIAIVIDLIVDHKKYEAYIRVVLFFGMLFFGLYLIEQSVVPLKEEGLIRDWITNVGDDPFRATLIGGLITAIIQSSSATVGIAIVLAKQNMISLAGSIAIMLGAELGTCTDTLIATIRGTRQAFKAGLFHLWFNLSTIILGLIFFGPFVELVKLLSRGQGIDNHIANAHMLFNIMGVILFIPFLSLMEKALNGLVPEKK